MADVAEVSPQEPPGWSAREDAVHVLPVGRRRLPARRALFAVGELLGDIGVSTEAAPLRTAVRRALGDPLADVVTANADGELRDLEGRPRPRLGRAIHRLDEDTLLIFDPVLLNDPELVSGVARTVALGLANRRLEADVSERLAQAQNARARVLEAGDAARRQIERDLHDGLQQTLVSLRLTLRIMQDEAGLSGEDAALLDDACELARVATQDLRSLAQGVYPMVLTASGLVAALQELSAAAPVAVALELEAVRRSTPGAEAAAYFCCCEAVTNVAKHAGTDRCVIRAREHAGTLFIEVADDGCGGASISGGTGLRGLGDRAAAVGGRLRVDSPAGEATIVRIDVPWPQDG